MKRSIINEHLKTAQKFFDRFGWHLPEFAAYGPAHIAQLNENSRIIKHRLGWDITDYGGGDFDALGLLLFTIRNGRASDGSDRDSIPYAEKIMISGINQLCPMHKHNRKVEDIINRGGGDLVLRLIPSAEDGSLDPDSKLEVFSDGRVLAINPGDHLRLAPGESVTIYPDMWHEFWAEGEACLVGEISTVNDDETDNVFLQNIPRFSEVTEDDAPLRLLVSDYEARRRFTC